MLSFREVLTNLNWSYLIELLISIIPALICISIHEMCHGIAAFKLGDRTAATQGRLSLNPLRHIDPVGLLMLVIFKFGWAKPVSVDMRNFRHPKRDMAITALAGPLSNIVLACIALVLYGALSYWLYDKEWGSTVLKLLYLIAYLSTSLGIFNLIPIPPLDGSKILFAFLPDNVYLKLMRYERYGMLLLIILMLSGITSGPLATATGFIFDKLFYFAQWAYKLIFMIAGR